MQPIDNSNCCSKPRLSVVCDALKDLLNLCGRMRGSGGEARAQSADSHWVFILVLREDPLLSQANVARMNENENSRQPASPL